VRGSIERWGWSGLCQWAAPWRDPDLLESGAFESGQDCLQESGWWSHPALSPVPPCLDLSLGHEVFGLL